MGKGFFLFLKVYLACMEALNTFGLNVDLLGTPTCHIW